ncbi:MAG TPA: DUF1702 family protein [Planctomycetota bacterium]|nr:DUF1702 family protein [Planctomycetota bacterium]
MALVPRRLLRIHPREATCRTRGFQVDDARIEDHLDAIGGAFLGGYHAALDEAAHRVGGLLEARPPSLRGFAYEGAAMATALGDLLDPFGARRFERYAAQVAAAQPYVAHVGYGLALARMPWRRFCRLDALDPLLRWLCYDGLGFHVGYFRWRAHGHRPPLASTGYAARVADQGLGRSLWFVCGARPDLIAAWIGACASERHGDLWSGVGLAATYAAGVGDAALRRLLAAAGTWADDLAQGAAFAIKARLRGGILTGESAAAGEVLCGLDADRVATIVDDSLPRAHDPLAYERWRRATREAIACRHGARRAC